ncbi:AraC family transcriptional regulator [Geminisphaera colitermitum]|uniref:AraC family transcriptional regulator n=1 Tax=Geminisphaera colitermitum TaxID=1148786 RepID=UPI000158C4EC|nr:AraC family transcriptional regulator [Geminisphaera colitermitum]
MSEPRDILRRHCSGESVTSPIPKLTLLRSDVVNEPSAVSYAPLFCMLASGRKRVWLGRQEFVYGPRDYLITSAELPLVAQVIEAPYLGFAFALDPEVIAEILLKLPKADPGRVPSKAVAVARAEDELFDAVGRLLRLLDRPLHIPIMAPMIEREILFHLLQGPHADTIRQLGAPASPLSQVRRGIDWIREHYNETMRVGRAAKAAGMSAPTFHRHFRAVTNLSPLQFQKRLRLEEARRRLLAERADAASIAFDVGYESPSQFSREYRRMFGAPPRRDASEARRRLLEPMAVS